jgi:hypothetical protein
MLASSSQQGESQIEPCRNPNSISCESALERDAINTNPRSDRLSQEGQGRALAFLDVLISTRVGISCIGIAAHHALVLCLDERIERDG